MGHWSWPQVEKEIGQLVDHADQDFNLTVLPRRVTHLCYEAPLFLTGKGKPKLVNGRWIKPRTDDPWFLRKIHAITGHVEWLCERHGIWCKEIDPVKVKQSLAGFSGANKNDQIAAALKIGLSLTKGPAQDDEADSFGVWLALLRDRDRQLGMRWDRLLYGRRGALL